MNVIHANMATLAYLLVKKANSVSAHPVILIARLREPVGL
jgi:hypothetical protein